MAGVEVPAIGAWMMGSSIPIRFNKLTIGAPFVDLSPTSTSDLFCSDMSLQPA